MYSKIKNIKKEYEEQDVPLDIENLIISTFRSEQKKLASKKRLTNCIYFFFKGSLISAALIALTFITVINSFPEVAKSASEIPILKDIVRVTLFRTYRYEVGNYWTKIEVPAVTNLENKQLASELNERYIKEGKLAYDSFKNKVVNSSEYRKSGHLYLSQEYKILVDSSYLLVLERTVQKIVGSSITNKEFDVVDKEKGVLLNLSILFKNEAYIQIINGEIKKQIKDEVQKSPDKSYFTDGEDAFNSISPTQQFYINKNHKLVIVFNSLEIAPNYMGVQEFIIPTELLKEEKVSNRYLN